MDFESCPGASTNNTFAVMLQKQLRVDSMVSKVLELYLHDVGVLSGCFTFSQRL